MKSWEERADLIWKSWPVSLTLGICCAAVAVWAVCVTPSPGTSIAILGAVAALMSIRPEMRPLEKGAWLIIITVLLVAEVHSIRGNDRDVAKERSDQQGKLQALNDKSSSIIGELKKTLEDVDKTLKQTQPHAAIRFVSFELPGAARPIAPNTVYNFNYHFINGGSETATDIKYLIKIYIGKPDDKQAQMELVRRFERAWKSDAQQYKDVLVPDLPHFGTTERTFDDKEIEELKAEGTIYYLLRFEYSDDSGRWGTDSCGAFQRTSQIETNIIHPCHVFEGFRYPIKQR